VVSFSHLDEGTAEDVWLAALRGRTIAPLDAEVDHLIVVAAHPDDETLGAGGLIRRVHHGGGRVTVVIATDGEASHPQSSSHSAGELAAARRSEAVAALRVLAPDARVCFLSLPDGGLRENAAALEAGLLGVVDALQTSPQRSLIVAPWSGDGHRDHRVTGETVARVAAARNLRHLGYPIWLWHWGQPDDVPWERTVGLALTPGEQSIKSRALRAYATQLRTASDAAGDEAIISERMRAHFTRPIELYCAESAVDGETLSREWFEDFYAARSDPWGFETRWYEERKRALLMAALPHARLGSVLEIGSATGILTLPLAERADHLIGMDISAEALQRARTRLGDRVDVTLLQGGVPQDWPPGEFDTLVFSEVGYYLSAGDLVRTIELMDAALSDEGCLIACHWRHPVAEYPATGDDVHRALRAHGSWRTLALHEEEDFVLEVFCRPSALSVARQEGLS